MMHSAERPLSSCGQSLGVFRVKTYTGQFVSCPQTGHIYSGVLFFPVSNVSSTVISLQTLLLRQAMSIPQRSIFSCEIAIDVGRSLSTHYTSNALVDNSEF